jgi:phosphohistidine phosphatase
MDLILWRHAQAHDIEAGGFDLERPLTEDGKKQAARMAAWLTRHLPKETRILASPARRAEQTAQALSRNYTLRQELAPGGTVAQLLELVHWPQDSGTVLVVGHQPVLGQTIAQLIGLKTGQCAVKKGAVWWLRCRQRELQTQTVIQTVQSADFL